MFGTKWRRLLAALPLLCALFACADQVPSRPDASRSDAGASMNIGTLPWSGGDICAGTPTGPLACGMTGRASGASTGQIRLASGDMIMARNPGNTADMVVADTTGGNVVIGDTTQVGAAILRGATNSELTAGSTSLLLSAGSSLMINSSAFGWFTTSDTPSISQVTQNNGSNPNKMTIIPQAPGAGASTTATGTPGSLEVDLSAPVSTGLSAQFHVRDLMSAHGDVWLGPQSNGNTGYGCFWLGATTPSSSNYVACGNGTTAFLGSGAGNISATLSTNSNITIGGSAASYGGGSNMVMLPNTGTAPTSNPSGGALFYGTNGGLQARGSGGAITDLAGPGNGTQNTQGGFIEKRVAFLRTTSTSAATIFTVGSLTASHVETIEAVINSIDTTTLASSAAARIACSFVNSAGTVSQLGATTTIYNHNYTAAPSCSISGLTINVQVTPKTTDTTDSQADVYVSVN